MRSEPSKVGTKGARRRTLRGPRREARPEFDAAPDRPRGAGAPDAAGRATLPRRRCCRTARSDVSQSVGGATRAPRRSPSTRTTRRSWRRSGSRNDPTLAPARRCSSRWRPRTTAARPGRGLTLGRSPHEPDDEQPDRAVPRGDRPERRVRPQRQLLHPRCRSTARRQLRRRPGAQQVQLLGRHACAAGHRTRWSTSGTARTRR